MSRRLLVFGTLILSLFLFSYSCQDHQLPGIPPSIQTLDPTPSGLKCNILLNLNVTDVGDIPVTEYGMVVVGNSVGGNLTDIPTVEKNTKIIFDMPFSQGAKKKISGICSDRIAFRAYAILSNGAVVYGEIHTLIV